MKTYAGIDLHSSNNFTGVINEHDQRLYRKRLPNRLDAVLSALEPFKDTLEGTVVESTYNWYWLVDGLQEHGYKLHLANPSAIKQYEGLKPARHRFAQARRAGTQMISGTHSGWPICCALIYCLRAISIPKKSGQ